MRRVPRVVLAGLLGTGLVLAAPPVGSASSGTAKATMVPATSSVSTASKAPAASMAPASDPPYGTVLGFEHLEVTEATLGTRYMPPEEIGYDVGALLFRNDVGSNQHVTVAFEVEHAAEYEIDLQAYRATSYGIYDVRIDGASVGRHDFYAPSNGPGELEYLTTAHLDAGTHHITFEAVGKNPSSTSYYAAFLRLVLLDEADREARYRHIVDLITDARDRLRDITSGIPPGNAVADRALRTRARRLDDELGILLRRADEVKNDPAALRGLKADGERTGLRVERFGDFVAAREARPSSGFGLMTADAMSLVYPRELPCDHCSTERPSLTLARGEYESMQAVLLPYGADLRRLSADVKRVVGPNGKPARRWRFRVEVDPVGSVFVENTPAVLPALGSRPENWEGWIPDPVRTDISRLDVPAWDMQPFWIELYADTEASAGTYTVTVEFSANGLRPETLEVDVEVWPFALPDRPGPETSITTKSTEPFARPAFSERWYILEKVYGLDDPEKDAARFAELERKYIDLLERFEIEPDLIYSTVPPSVEELRKIERRHGLRQFNVLYLPPYAMEFDPEKPETWQPQIDQILQTIETAMKEYEAAGLADKAYIYGFDESRQLPLAREILGQIEERFPELPVMSTYLDASLGEDSGLAGPVDIWVPGVEHFDSEALARAKKRGDKVYWYIHQAVRSPLPNWFNGYAPSDTRILLGPMSHTMEVDGFLYYNIARWIDHGPMDDGILSSWDPRTYPTANGDGSLFYPGADGPLASQRLHNFRDGMEDFGLLDVLEKSIARAEAGGAPEDVLAVARRLLEAESVVTSTREYTKDPAVYRQWRNDVADMIVRLGRG